MGTTDRTLMFGGGDESAPFGNRFVGSLVESLPVPLPKDYLGGIDIQRRDFEAFDDDRFCYLRGEWSKGVVWYYYLYAAAVKLPVGVWGLAVVAIPGIVTSVRRGDRFGLCVVAATGASLFVFVSSQSSLSGHIRYALPAFGFGFILIGAASVWATTAWRRRYIGAMLIWQVGSVLSQTPHTPSYANELVGGPENGWRHLTGSNIDWGQDIWWLKRWIDCHPELGPYQLALFTTVDPRLVGLEGYSVPPAGPTRAAYHLPPQVLRQYGPRPGVYVISARFLTGDQGEVPNGRGERAIISRHSLEYFRFFHPTERIGGALFVFVISLDEANQVRLQLGMPLLEPDAPDP